MAGKQAARLRQLGVKRQRYRLKTRSTCRIHQTDAAIALLCAPSTACLRNNADCPEQGGIHAHFQQVEAD